MILKIYTYYFINYFFYIHQNLFLKYLIELFENL